MWQFESKIQSENRLWRHINSRSKPVKITQLTTIEQVDKLLNVKSVEKSAQSVSLGGNSMSDEPKKLTAKEFLSGEQSNQFKSYCSEAGIEPTKRQVRKFRRKRGLAYKACTHKL